MSTRHGAAIEEALFAIVSAAVEERLRPVIERLNALEVRLEQLEPDDTGLTYKQAAAALSVTPKTIRRWVDSNKIVRGGGTPRSPRIARSEVRRLLHGQGPRPNTPTRPAQAEKDGLDLAALARGMLSDGAKRPRRV
jgi:excisionase family DNA binding protein